MTEREQRAVATGPAVSGAQLLTAGPKNPIIWIEDLDGLRAAVQDLRVQPAIGLDVETTVDLASLCLVQLATAERTYVIDPLALRDLSALGEVLGRDAPLKIIHHSQFEQRVLAEHGLTIDGVFDTLEASRRKHGIDALGGHGLSIVCERELGFALDKGEQTSNWARRPLTDQQAAYAALDAECLLGLWLSMRGV